MTMHLRTPVAWTDAAPRTRSVWSWLVSLTALRAQRRQLASLDDHILRDIGISREDAEAEASRPLWDAPRHWLK